MARVGMARFSVLLAILPATAAVVGAVVLSQRPTPAEVAGIALVVVAVALNERRAGGSEPVVGT
jgi:inner membrane transporter RhtA